MLPSTGTVGDSYGNAMAESADGAYKTELVWRRKPFRGFEGSGIGDVPVGLVAGSRSVRTSPWGYRTPERTETEYYANQAAQAPHYKGGTKIRPYQ